MGNPVLNGLGQALRWLRDRLGKKQYQVANAAGITKGMLSAYETGRQRPSLETLEKLLDTLGCDLHDLHNAIQIVNGRPQDIRQPLPDEPRPAGAPRGMSDIYTVLGQTEPLPLEEERALTQLLDGFHRLIRYMHRTLQQRTQYGSDPTGEGS